MSNRFALTVSAFALTVFAGTALGSMNNFPASSLNALDLQPGDIEIVDTARAAERVYIEIPGKQEFTGQLIVRPKQTEARRIIREEAQRLGRQDVRLDRSTRRIAPLTREYIQLTDLYVVDVPEGMDENAFSAFLMATGDYEYAEPNWLLSPAINVPNDPQFANQWQHINMQSSAGWTMETGSSEIIVAITDTGCDLDHPDLQAAYVPGYNAVDREAQVDGGDVEDLNGHGTFCAGLAAAIGNNSTGIAGVGWNFRVMPIRVSNLSSGNANIVAILRGIEWAAENGARIVNTSYSGVSGAAVQTTGEAIKREFNALNFWAAGNSNVELPDVVRPDIVVVGSTTSSDTKSGFSNFGTMVDVSAPGSSVRSTRRGGSYGNSSGTSFASPIAAGLGGLIMSANERFTPDDVQDIMYATCDPINTSVDMGEGRVNVRRAIEMAQTFVPRLLPPFSETFDSTSLDENVWIEIVGAGVAGGALEIGLDDSIESAPIRTNKLADEKVVLTAEVNASGIEAGDTITLSYTDGDGNWIDAIVAGSTEFADGAATLEVIIPAEDLSSSTSLRITTSADDADDLFTIDSVGIGVFEFADVPFFETFESGELVGTRWASSSDAQVIDAGASAISGTRLLELAAGGIAETERINTTPFFGQALQVAVAARAVNADAADSLRVEVRDFQGNWRTADTILPSPTFEQTLVPLGFLDFGTTFAVRFTSEGDNNGELWQLDDLYVGLNPPAIDDCAPDFTGDGQLDFFDVSAFLDAFSANDPSADITGDGTFDFFDVAAYLDLFSAGCP